MQLIKKINKKKEDNLRLPSQNSRDILSEVKDFRTVYCLWVHTHFGIYSEDN